MHPARLSRLAAAAVAAAGAVLLGASLGGVAGVDGRLQDAVAPAPAPAFVSDHLGHRHGDCPGLHHDRRTEL
jgi:hypothetical protein